MNLNDLYHRRFIHLSMEERLAVVTQWQAKRHAIQAHIEEAKAQKAEERAQKKTSPEAKLSKLQPDQLKAMLKLLGKSDG